MMSALIASCTPDLIITIIYRYPTRKYFIKKQFAYCTSPVDFFNLSLASAKIYRNRNRSCSSIFGENMVLYGAYCRSTKVLFKKVMRSDSYRYCGETFLAYD